MIRFQYGRETLFSLNTAPGMVMVPVPTHDRGILNLHSEIQSAFESLCDSSPKELKHLNENEMTRAYTEEGILVNSAQFNGIENKTAIEKITDYIESKNLGKRTVNYKDTRQSFISGAKI